MTIHSPRVAFWALVLVNLIWGAGFVVVDDAIKVMPAYTFNAFRFALATLALWPLWLLSSKSSNHSQTAEAHTNSTSQLLKTGCGLGLLLFLGFALQAKALLYTSVSNTGFITGMCVPLVPIIGFLLYKTKVGPEVWVSVVTATIGLYFLTMGDKMEFNLGDILVAISAVCYASHITLVAKYGGSFNVVLLSMVQLGSAAVYSALAAIVEGLMNINADYPPLFEQFTNWGVIAAIAYSGILASAFAYWVQTASQRLIAPHQIALIFAMEPIFAHVAAFMILGEHLGLQGWLGASLIIAGMLYAELGGKGGGKKKITVQSLDQMAAPIDDTNK